MAQNCLNLCIIMRKIKKSDENVSHFNGHQLLASYNPDYRASCALQVFFPIMHDANTIVNHHFTLKFGPFY